MRPTINPAARVLAVCLCLVAGATHGQFIYWNDTFNGGTTVGGWAPNLWAGGSGSFEISIPAGSTVHQAFLLATSHEDLTADYTLELNGTPLTITPADEAIAFPDPTYAGDAHVCILDVTALIDPVVTNYTIDAPFGAVFLYQDYMLFVAFENEGMSPVTSYIVLNDQALAPTAISWNLTGLEPFPSGGDVCVSMWFDYACDAEWDAEFVDVNNTYIGKVGTNDTNSGGCAGILGNYTYSNGVATALGPDDTADGSIYGADALFLMNDYVSPGDTEVLIEAYDGPDFAGFDNACWGAILTYGSSCDIPDYTVEGDATICPGQSSGLSASGGATYAWSPSSSLDDASSASPIATPASTTTYEVEITFDNGCTVTEEVTVEVLLDALAIETAVVPALCEGTGSIEIVSTEGGTSPYSYTLDGSEIFSTLVEQLAPGVYTIGAEDANGCSGSVILEVEQTFDPVNFLTTLSAPYCDVPGSIAITEFTNGNAPYDVWLNGVLQDDLVFEDLIAGSYLIEVADAGGCTGDANVELEALDVVLVPDLSLTNGICETPGSIEVTGVDGGDAPYSYWLDGTEMPTPIFENLGAGDYAVTVTDASGCIGSTGATLITEYPGVAAFTASPFVGEFPLTVNFNNSSIYFNTFEWDFGTGDFSDLENPQFTYTLPGQYEVTLTGIDPINGCTATATWTVYVLLPNNVFIPNSFTPDNDGINDVFKVISEGIDPEYYDLMIFDRWGEIIFRSSDPTQAWTGNVHGGEYYVPTGVYPYLLKFRFVDSVTDEKVAGHVTVVR